MVPRNHTRLSELEAAYSAATAAVERAERLTELIEAMAAEGLSQAALELTGGFLESEAEDLRHSRRGARAAGTLRRDYGELLLRAGLIESAEAQFRECVTISRTLQEDEPEALGWVRLAAACLARGEHAEAETHYVRGLGIARNRFPRVAALASIGLAILFSRRRSHDEALRASSEALMCAQQLSDPSFEARILGNSALVLKRAGLKCQAAKSLQEAWRLSDAVHDRRSAAVALQNLGAVRVGTGELLAGLEDLSRAAECFRSVNDGWGSLLAEGNIAGAYYRLGSMRKAYARLKECLQQSRTGGWAAAEADTLRGLALVFMARGETRRARVCLARSQAMFERLGQSAILDEVEVQVAHLSILEGRPDDAIQRCDQLRAQSTAPSASVLASLWHIEARAQIHVGAPARAMKCASRAAEYFERERQDYDLSECLCTRASAARMITSSVAVAERDFEHALRIQEAIGARRLRAETQLEYSAFQGTVGDTTAAERMLRAAGDYFAEQGMAHGTGRVREELDILSLSSPESWGH